MIGTKDEVDYLTCGRCLTEFPLKKITTFIEHKKKDCEILDNAEDEPGLVCLSCPQEFMTAVGLLKHVQFTHNLKIFLEKGAYKGGIQQVSGEDAGTCEDENEAPVDLVTHSKANMTFEHETQSVDTEQVSTVGPTELQPPCCLTGACQIENSNQSVLRNESQPPNNQSNLSVETQLYSTMNQSSVRTDQMTCSPSALDRYVTDSNKTEGHCEGIENSMSMDAIDDEKSCDSQQQEAIEDIDSDKCCSSQKCGVTVIPGSHESLKKCCYAVAPKKRKRHMETKHMPSFWKSRFGRRRLLNGRETRKPLSKSQGTIYIDLQPETGMVTTTHAKEKFTTETKRTTNFSNSSSSSMGFHVTGMTRDTISNKNSPKSNRGSVILQPGAVYSIPISYTVPTPGMDAGKSGGLSMNLLEQPSHSAEPVPSHLTNDQETIQQTPGGASSNQTGILQATTEPLHPEQQDTEVYGIDIQSIISQATKQMNLLPNSLEKTEAHGKEIHSDEGEGRHGRKRRYPTSKPFKCDQCEHAFNQRIHLKKHMSKHTGIKPFKCQQCDYSTVERSHLKVHIRIHTGEKPFKCTYCEYATAQNSTLKIHLKRHHTLQGKEGSPQNMDRTLQGKDGQMRECNICGHVCLKEDLLKHQSDHHQTSHDTSANQSIVTMELSEEGMMSNINSDGETKK